MMIRGAGGWDSRELLSALDNLGVQHNEGADRVFISFNGALLGENLGQALSVYSRIIQEPTFPKEQFSAVVAGAYSRGFVLMVAITSSSEASSFWKGW